MYSGSYDDIIERNIGIISESDQEKIRKTSVGIVGVGGCGGLTSIILAKMGFGKIVIYDNDRYEVSNLNRQMLATMETVNKFKAEVAGDVLLLHNPYIMVEAHVEFLDSIDKTVEAFKEVDVIILTVDNLSTIVTIMRAAKRLNIPVIITGPFGWKCFVSIVEPDGMDYETLINSPSLGKELTEDVVRMVNLFQREFIYNIGGFTKESAEHMRDLDAPIVTFAPVVNLTSTVAVLELVKRIIGVGRIYKFPQYFTMDLLTGEAWSVQEAGIKAGITFGQRYFKHQEEL
ncbi:MAG TPA: ThiF family adenylyltransferase [Clostridia bacterium]